ncbi:peptidylprolyl isomerase [Sphingomonas sp. Leaf33]|uniref:peptidylprolyl isomerase n=1 Tax=Sphingomonas sp. Leaf33 TaxID=1736215 RepID=UPI000701C7C5|nr:peptidylprolyl isomerase [Sphingomonas sp. Leaf33]KQN24870.1 peptidylprolyl isomerase [Sphingomonas sp. Leaf33]
MFARFAAIALFATAATAQDAPPTAPSPPAPAPATVRVVMTTTAGPITLALEKDRAPVTTANFLRYVDARRFDGITFYRSMKLPWNAGLIQAGQRDPVKLFKPIAHEPTSQTGLTHTDGAISMARLAPGTATADFSIVVGDMTGLDAKPQDPGFAVFGRVVEGMDVVKTIWNSPRSPTRGEGVMKGEMLEPPVKVLTVRRVS